MIELKISEELLLLTLNREKKTFASNSSTTIKYGLAAAIAYELIEQGKYTVDGDNLKKIDTEPTNDIVINLALKTLSDTENKLRNVIAKLSGKSKKFKELLIKSLLDNQIIKHEEGLKNQFRIWYEKPFQHSKSKLNDIVYYDKKNNAKYLTLIAIIQACKLTKKVFPTETFGQDTTAKIKALVIENVFYKAIKSSAKGSQIHILFTLITLIVMLLKELCSR